MKSLNKKMLLGTLATALVLGGSFAATLHNAYADDTAATATSGSAAADGTTAPAIKPQQLAKQNNIDLGLRELSFRTGVIIGKSSIDVDKALEGGSTLSAIASGQVADGGDYLTELLDMPNTNINMALSTGRITSDQADQLKTYVESKVKESIADTDYRDADTEKEAFGKALNVKGHHINPKSLAKFFGISVAELQSDLDSGKSLGDIAKEKGISEDQLLNKLQDEMKSSLKDLITRTKPQPIVTTDDSSATVTDSTYSN